MTEQARERILVINPGSTSTKVAVFEGDTLLAQAFLPGSDLKGKEVWEEFPGKTAVLFWWFNMATSADWSVTPRPAYFADGRKRADVYSDPPALGKLVPCHLSQPIPKTTPRGIVAEVAAMLKDHQHL